MIAAFSKRIDFFTNDKFTSPTGPFRCFSIPTSTASPCHPPPLAFGTVSFGSRPYGPPSDNSPVYTQRISRLP